MSLLAVKTLTVSGISFEIVSAQVASGSQTEEIKTTTLTDTGVTKVPRYQTEDTDVTLMCAYAGTLATIGNATLAITVTDDAGNAHVCTTLGFVRSAIPQEVAIDGERRMLQQVVFTSSGATVTFS